MINHNDNECPYKVKAEQFEVSLDVAWKESQLNFRRFEQTLNDKIELTTKLQQSNKALDEIREFCNELYMGGDNECAESFKQHQIELKAILDKYGNE
jgi:hypothetical protein